MRNWLPLILLVLVLLAACVDPEDLTLRATNDLIVVDGTITNLAEPQQVRLNRSRADRLTGRFGTLPITKATVEVVMDSSVVVAAHETVDGTYQLPNDFRGLVGHAYQLRFTTTDGTRYVSSQQVMQAVPPIDRASAQFNLKSLSTPVDGFFTAGHDIFIDVQDPANQHNYYRWDWTLYERQYWCKTCTQGVYAVHGVLTPYVFKDQYYFTAGNEQYEDCFIPPTQSPAYPREDFVPKGYWYYDYQCRTQCWEVLRGYDINVFDDQYSNGGLIVRRKVAQIPFYQRAACLVDIRQSSLTKDAYRYYKLFQDQTQNTGGLADTPPAAPMGNVRNAANPREGVVGYFTASAVSLVHQWLDRKDTEGIPFGSTDPTGPHNNAGDDLFYALYRRRPYPEPPPPYTGEREEARVRIWPNTDRPPTAVCVLSDSRTPFKPNGWRD